MLQLGEKHVAAQRQGKRYPDDHRVEQRGKRICGKSSHRLREAQCVMAQPGLHARFPRCSVSTRGLSLRIGRSSWVEISTVTPTRLNDGNISMMAAAYSASRPAGGSWATG